MTNVINLNEFRKDKLEDSYEETPPLEDLSSVPTVVWALRETRKVLEKYYAGDITGANKDMLALLEVGDPNTMDPSDAHYFFRKLLVLNDVMYDCEFWLFDLELWNPWAADQDRDKLWKDAWEAKTNSFITVLEKFNKEDFPAVEYQIHCYIDSIETE